MKGTSFKRAHEQSTTAKPFLFIISLSSFDTHCLPTGLLKGEKNVHKEAGSKNCYNKYLNNQQNYKFSICSNVQEARGKRHP
jgi:hypothetical protein